MNQTEHQCPYCELRFAYLTEVKDHITHDHPAHAHVVEDLDPHELPHHGDGARGVAVVPGHQCPWCELRFASTNELVDHLAKDHDAHRSVTR